ncbi:hypothetical protein [Devosia sp.]|uniref:hypothetical protein n=1 Tax=Devosia sp. TaxID=1871048 RepID=UPI001B2EADC5|nr:hypothetical protein [Devosia sp.]MBO9588552.1 hypothetical protein [Devosia sp.]
MAKLPAPTATLPATASMTPAMPRVVPPIELDEQNSLINEGFCQADSIAEGSAYRVSPNGGDASAQLDHFAPGVGQFSRKLVGMAGATTDPQRLPWR